MSKEVIFDTAAILGVKHKIKGSAVLNEIEFVAIYDPKTASQLGQSKFLVYNQDHSPKEGFKTMELEIEMHAFTLILEPKGLEQHALNIAPQLADKFKIFKSGGKKKKAASIRVKFTVHHSGSIDEAHQMLDYIHRIGTAPGALKITPLQADLFKEEKEKEKSKRGKKDKPDAVQATMPATGDVKWPVADDRGVYSDTDEDTVEACSWSVQDRVDAVIRLIRISEQGWVYGWDCKFAGNVGAKHEPLKFTNICSTSELAIRAAAEAIHRYAGQIAVNATEQVKEVAFEVQQWAAPIINPGVAEPVTVQ